MSSQCANTIASRLRYIIACFWSGYCPTSKEIQSDDIKELAGRLKTNSDKETLTNVLAWQDSRISYWHERWTLPIVFLFSLAVAFFFYTLIFLNPLIFVLAFFSSIGFGLGILATIFLLVRSRKIPIWSGLNSVYAGSIPMDFLVKHKLAICRDYAKLTACLLRNIYPNQEIYFASAFQHIATGISIKGRLYMLDKFLPLATIDKWSERWKSKKPLKRLIGNCIESVNMNSFLSNMSSTKLDKEKLAIEMSRLLNIKGQTNNVNPSSLEILRWKKGNILYEEDEFVNYSLSKLIEKNIFNERVSLSQVTKLEVLQDKDDLIFRIKVKLN
jgi:predicted transglutaminase-like protease